MNKTDVNNLWVGPTALRRLKTCLPTEKMFFLGFLPYAHETTMEGAFFSAIYQKIEGNSFRDLVWIKKKIVMCTLRFLPVICLSTDWLTCMNYAFEYMKWPWILKSTISVAKVTNSQDCTFNFRIKKNGIRVISCWSIALLQNSPMHENNETLHNAPIVVF